MCIIEQLYIGTFTKNKVNYRVDTDLKRWQFSGGMGAIPAQPEIKIRGRARYPAIFNIWPDAGYPEICQIFGVGKDTKNQALEIRYPAKKKYLAQP